MDCLFVGIISQILFLPKMIFRQNDVMKNCTLSRSIVFSIQTSPVKVNWLLIAIPNQMNSVHRFSSLFPNNLVHSDKYLWLQSIRMGDNADISVGSKYLILRYQIVQLGKTGFIQLHLSPELDWHLWILGAALFWHCFQRWKMGIRWL